MRRNCETAPPSNHWWHLLNPKCMSCAPSFQEKLKNSHQRIRRKNPMAKPHQASTVPKKQGQTSTQNRFDRLSGPKILPLTGNPQLFTGDLPILIAILMAESKMFFQPRSLILEHPKKNDHPLYLGKIKNSCRKKEVGSFLQIEGENSLKKLTLDDVGGTHFRTQK